MRWTIILPLAGLFLFLTPRAALAFTPEKGHTLRVPITRDASFSDVGSEARGNNGGGSQLKVKSFQEFSVIDFDPTPLKGRVILSAELHVHLSGREILHRITVSSLSADWVQGSAAGYQPQAGSSCFQFRKSPDVPWSYAGSDMGSVMLGQGNTIWHSADASPPDHDRWQTISIDPRVLAARVAGISYGLVIFDDTGSEWTRHGEQLSLRMFPNRFFSSTRQSSSAPYLTVKVGGQWNDVPAPPVLVGQRSADQPAGEAIVTWKSQGAIGYLAEIDGKPVPHYLVPLVSTTGQPLTMHLRDLNLPPGQTVKLTVRAVNAEGTASPPARWDIALGDARDKPIDAGNIQPFAGNAALPKLGDADVSVIDAMDKYQPSTGKLIPPEPAGYLSANHLWTANGPLVRLQAARGEYVSFQVLLRGPARNAAAAIQFSHPGKRAPTTAFFQMVAVDSVAGPVPDPLIFCDGKFADAPETRSLLCEVFVPFTGISDRGKLVLHCDGGDLTIEIDLTVWNFTLPKYLSFLPEMNCYGLGADEMDYYRLAHLNRTVLNRLPYEHNGYVDAAPKWDGHKLDFADWDKRFGPLFDGSAFADDPRRGVPIECFYLPMFENWPTPIEGNYNGSYWADHAFTAGYRDAFISAARQFAEHFDARRWNQTIFQCYFNGKVEYKRRGWSRETSPWILDEPGNFQDFWALRWFGQQFHAGVDPVAAKFLKENANLEGSPPPAKLLFRCDVSRPQWQRDSLDGVLNYAVVAQDAFDQYPRIVLDRKADDGQVLILYGSSNNPADSNTQPADWCVSAYLHGADGVLPWQTIGNAESWKKADALSLFYPASPSPPAPSGRPGAPLGQTGHAGAGPFPSIRLKSYLRGEEDVEYLVMLGQLRGEARNQLLNEVRASLGLANLTSLSPPALWQLRVRIGQMLSAAQPPPRDRLVNLGGESVLGSARP